MKSINDRYSLLQIRNNNLYQKIISGDTSIVANKGNPGYIYAPYILMESPTTIISDGGFDTKYWRRIREVEKRREKIEKIMNKINGTICD